MTSITLCVSEMTTDELHVDITLQNFYAELKKHNGMDYELEQCWLLWIVDSMVVVASTPLPKTRS